MSFISHCEIYMYTAYIDLVIKSQFVEAVNALILSLKLQRTNLRRRATLLSGCYDDCYHNEIDLRFRKT